MSTAPTPYGISRTVALSYDDAVARVREELQKEGFGVLTEIDVKETIKKKLDRDFARYIILGACNPPLAHQALTAEPAIGLLLPCNVIVYETRPGESVVAAFDPTVAVDLAENKAAIAEVARVVREKMERVIDRVAGTAG
jgi:uncharacterized protein (DUF302 family)